MIMFLEHAYWMAGSSKITLPRCKSYFLQPVNGTLSRHLFECQVTSPSRPLSGKSPENDLKYQITYHYSYLDYT
jgi:hypothetical protein